jgi:opacity protein-like surface antigen
MTTLCRGIGATLLTAWLIAPPPASAQTFQGAIVSGAAGVTAAESKTSPSISASAGYRFNRGIAFTIELASVPSIDSQGRIDIGRLDTILGFGDLGGLPRIGFTGSDDSGSLTSFTANLRLEMPTLASRVLPYAVLGGGVANVKESFTVVYSVPVLAASFIGAPVPIEPITYNFRESSTDMALTLGGGVSLLTGKHLSFDIDLRYLHLLGYEDRDVGRFGAGVSYRF